MLTKPQHDAAMAFNHQLREIIQKLDGLASQADGMDGPDARSITKLLKLASRTVGSVDWSDLSGMVEANVEG